MNTIIKVTQEDIENGLSEMNHCPIALAVKRKFSLKHALVLPSDILINGKTYKNNRRVCGWIVRFDNGKKVRPFQFELGGK